MLTLDAVQTALVASDNKTGRWAFHISDINGVGYGYYTDAIGEGEWTTGEAWGTGEAWWDGTGNNSVVLMDFSGIELRRNASESGIIAPSDVTFSLSNQGNTLDFSTFKGGTVLIELFLWNPTYGEHKIAGWKFNIKTCEPGYQKLFFTCEDFLQAYLRGYYPNTRLPEEIFPSSREYIGDMVCVPVPFGSAYVPLRDVYITNAGYLLLGDPARTYTIEKIRSPRSLGLKSEWDQASYTFTQSTKADDDAVNWRVFQAIIADGNNDGTVDTHGFWGTPGGPILDPPVLFSRDDTVSTTNPADVIDFVLKDMGVPSANIDSTSFTTAHGTFDGYTVPLTFIGAFWYKQDRQKVLSQLLTQCHSCLDVGETIKMRVLVKTSRATITDADVLRTSEQGEGTFSYKDIVNEDLSDSAYGAYQETGESQDELKKVLVSTGGAATVISSEVIECPFVQDSRNVKRIVTLDLQRKLGKVANVRWLNKSTGLALQPDDVLSINDSNYGGAYDVLIDSIKINKDLSLQIQCTKFKQALSDWADLDPTTYVIPVDDTTHPWSPVITGPDSPGTPLPLNAIADRLRVGNGAANYLLIEPAAPRVSLYNSGEKYRVGNLNGFLGVVSDLFGFGAGSASAGYANLIYDVTNGLRLRSGTTNVVNIDNSGNIAISGGISASTIDIGGADVTSFHVDIDGNMWLGAAAFNIATNPFAVSNAGVLRAVSGTVGGWTLATDKLSAGTDADYIGLAPATGIQLGDSTFADAKFSVTPAGLLKAISGTIGGWTLATTTLTGTGVTLSSTGDAYLAIGTTPPTSPTAGTGIFINKTGLFGLNANNQRFKILEDGSGFLGESATLAWTTAGVVTAAGFTLSTTALYTGSKTAYNDANAGVHVGTDGIGIGNNLFTVSAAGALVSTSATITGAVNATSGKFGTATNYWSVGATGLTATSASTDVILNFGKTDFDNTQTGFILGYDFSASAAKFLIGDSTRYLNWDGAALTYTKGTLVETTIQMYTNVATLKTSATAGDGSADSAGMVLTYEGLFGCGANQTSTIAAANANVRILNTGAAYFKGTVSASMVSGSYLYGSSLMTKGTYLSATCLDAATTLYVGDTTDFAASGSASFIDSANDRDVFTYAGKTGTTLTGCSGVLAHTVSASNKPLVIPAAKGMYVSDAVNEMRFFGDRGDGTIEELANIGIKTATDYVIGSFGSTNSTLEAIEASCKNQTCVVFSAESVGANAAFGFSSNARVYSGNSAGIYGGHITAYRGAYATDTGTCSTALGLEIFYGATTALSTPGTTTLALGLRIRPTHAAGTTITTDKCFVIEAPDVIWSGGTVTNYYAIYQEDPDAKNFFAGNIEIGDGKYFGLAVDKGRIVFTDAATDTITFSTCDVVLPGGTISYTANDTAGAGYRYVKVPNA